MNKLNILQSGFVTYNGANISSSDNEIDTGDLINAIKFNQTIPDQQPSYCYSIEINKLMQDFYNTKNALESFEFRERILKIAKYIFNTPNFYDWCYIQNNSPYFTAIHKKFILDTLKFINTGKRNMNILVWTQLITRIKRTNNDDKLDYNIKELFNNHSPDSCNDSYLLNDVIIKWVNKDKGISDLLYFLYIVFGSKDVIS